MSACSRVSNSLGANKFSPTPSMSPFDAIKWTDSFAQTEMLSSSPNGAIWSNGSVKLLADPKVHPGINAHFTTRINAVAAYSRFKIASGSN